MTSPSSLVVLPPPPPDRARAARVVVYVTAALCGVLSFLGGGPALGVLGCLLGALGYLLAVVRRQEVGGALAMAALDRTARGRFDESRALLDAVPKNVL